MIGRIRGVLIHKQPPELLVEVGGVGYELTAPMGTCYNLPETGAEVLLYTHLVVRDDAHQLYAFGRELERQLFRELIRVSGVGAKLAVAILSSLSVDELVLAVQSQDLAQLTRVPGVGRKTAERLLLDLRDRLGEDFAVAGAGAAPALDRQVQEDALSGLAALGYKPTEARRALQALPADQLAGQDSAGLIKAALSHLMKR